MLATNQRFVHLRLKTQYSQLNSVLRIESLGKYAEEEKPLAIAMLDDMSASGVFRFCKTISGKKVKPIIGLNVTVLEEGINVPKHQERAMCIGVLAMNEKGYRNILQIIHRSQFSYGKSPEGGHFVEIKDIQELNEGLICLSGGYNGLVASYFLNQGAEKALELCRLLKQTFDKRFYIELTRHGREGEREVEDFAIQSAMDLNIPLVATNDVHFLVQKNFEAYDALSCVKDGTFVSQEDRWRLNKEFYLKTEEQMKDLFSDIPEAIENTVNIARRCSFLLSGHAPMLPSFIEKSEEEPLFIRISKEGLKQRLSEHNITNESLVKDYEQRLEYEASVITKMGFVGYFLIVCDFVKWAKSNGISVGPGRGSGAGSIVAWCLEITNVDPIKYGLIFERFLNPERVSMPDFDIDFCQTRRHEVVEYVAKKYGNDRVGSIITFGKLQAKAALKDIGRVLQMPYKQIDEICKLIPFNPIEPVTLSAAIEMDDRLRQEALRDADVQNLIDITLEVEGLNRHTSTHAAGIVIGSIPLNQMVPVHKDNESNLSVIGFDMKDCESVGLVKFDFLGLKTLSVINETIKNVEERSGIKIDIDKIDEHDKKTLELLRSSRTKGVFQLEATVPREALQRIEVDGIPDISAITSLNRPGPMAYIPNYIKRKNGNEEVSYPHPLSEQVLKETYGIMIYQEQVMKMAQVLAGYSMGDADLLRRAMGKKIKEEMDRQESVFTEGAKRNHISEELAKEIFRMIEKFAGYGFNKSHSVAYSIISYQTAYLKANYPVEFFTAMANLDSIHTEKVVEIISDAKSRGIEVLAPNINTSKEKFIVQSGTSILYGMGAVKSVSDASVGKVVEERLKNGNFKDIFDFAKRCGQYMNRRQVEALIKAGCFDQIHKKRSALLSNVEEIIKYGANARKATEGGTNNLFGEDESISVQKPDVKESEAPENTMLSLMSDEFEAFGFYLNNNPLKEYEEEMVKNGVVNIADVNDLALKYSSKTILLGGVITKVKQRSGKKGRFAFITIADSTSMFELAVFNDNLITNKRELFAEGVVVITGVSLKVDQELGLRLNVIDIFPIKEAFLEDGKVIKNFIEKERERENRASAYKKYSQGGSVQGATPEQPKTYEANKGGVLQNKEANGAGSANGVAQTTGKKNTEALPGKNGQQAVALGGEELGSSNNKAGNKIIHYTKRYVNCVLSSKEDMAKIIDFATSQAEVAVPDAFSPKLIINYMGSKINTGIAVAQATINTIRQEFGVYIE